MWYIFFESLQFFICPFQGIKSGPGPLPTHPLFPLMELLMQKEKLKAHEVVKWPRCPQMVGSTWIQRYMYSIHHKAVSHNIFLTWGSVQTRPESPASAMRSLREAPASSLPALKIIKFQQDKWTQKDCPPCPGSSDPSSQPQAPPPGQCSRWWPSRPRPPGTWLTSTAGHWRTCGHYVSEDLYCFLAFTSRQYLRVPCRSAGHSPWRRWRICHCWDSSRAIPQTECPALDTRWRVDHAQSWNISPFGPIINITRYGDAVLKWRKTLLTKSCIGFLMI